MTSYLFFLSLIVILFANHVHFSLCLLAQAPSMSLPAKKKEKRAKCTFDYQAAQDDELSMKVGDIVHNVKDSIEGWCEGELNGKQGRDKSRMGGGKIEVFCNRKKIESRIHY